MRSIAHSQRIQAKRTYYEKEDFFKHMSEMKLWFLKRGYPENIAEQQLGKFEYSKLP